MKMNLLFLDTETTGIEGHLIQLAYKRAGEEHVFVENYKPPVPIEIEAMATHHITERMVAEKIPFLGSKDHKALQELLKDSVLVAHNARFDMSILIKEGIAIGDYICTWRVAQAMYDYPQYKMQYLRYLWGIDDIPEAHAHSAAGDVMVLEKVFEHLAKDYALTNGTSEDETIQKFIEISKNPLLLRRATFGKYAGKTFEEIKVIDLNYLQWMGTLADKGEDWLYTVNYYLGK
jgi:exodeoxyribonuclease X